jgi:hypothetical protein
MKKLLMIQFGFLAMLAGQQPKDEPWAPLKFLAGEWVATGGRCSFQPDLQGRILVRKSYAEYPATSQRPAFRHDDLMIVYQDAGGNLRADYFDNEGHVIRYAVRAGRDSAEFLSDASDAAPRFRLTYLKTAPDELTLKFEIAPPGKPDSFKTYLDARLRREGR